MEYLIAGIRIDIPHRFTTGAFGMALAPFAAENKTETDAGSNRMAGPVPGTATTAAPSPSETPGTERSAPHPATSPADTAQPDLILHTGLLAGDTAGYCELDAFDFTDADADCRFGRDTEGYLLTMTPRDGSAPARHPTCTHPPAAPAIRLRRRAASAPCGRATSSCFAAKGAISCTASSGSKQASAAKETVPYAHQPQGMPRPLRHPRKTPQRGIPPRGHSVSPCPGTVITARRSIASARISSP